jgi:hypothetical protein
MHATILFVVTVLTLFFLVVYAVAFFYPVDKRNEAAHGSRFTVQKLQMR